jgi:hypothetical protein
VDDCHFGYFTKLEKKKKKKNWPRVSHVVITGCAKYYYNRYLCPGIFRESSIHPIQKLIEPTSKSHPSIIHPSNPKDHRTNFKESSIHPSIHPIQKIIEPTSKSHPFIHSSIHPIQKIIEPICGDGHEEVKQHSGVPSSS